MYLLEFVVYIYRTWLGDTANVATLVTFGVNRTSFPAFTGMISWVLGSKYTPGLREILVVVGSIRRSSPGITNVDIYLGDNTLSMYTCIYGSIYTEGINRQYMSPASNQSFLGFPLVLFILQLKFAGFISFYPDIHLL